MDIGRPSCHTMGNRRSFNGTLKGESMKLPLRIAIVGIFSLVVAPAPGAMAARYSGTITGLFDDPVLSGAFLQTGTRQPVAQDNAGAGGGAGIGTSSVTWGAADGGGTLAPSTVEFSGNSFDDVAPDQVFPLGTLTFVNGPSAPGSLIFGLTMHLSAGEGIAPFAGPVRIVSTLNGNTDPVADADVLSFGTLELPSTVAAFENTAVAAIIYGKIGADARLVVTSLGLAPGEDAHGCVDEGTFVESELPCASACGSVCAATRLALAGPLCGSERLPRVLSARIDNALRLLSRGARSHNARKAKAAVRLAMKRLRRSADIAHAAAKRGRISATCAETVAGAVGNARSQAEPLLGTR
jgi:hypothetical protein